MKQPWKIEGRTKKERIIEVEKEALKHKWWLPIIMVYIAIHTQTHIPAKCLLYYESKKQRIRKEKRNEMHNEKFETLAELQRLFGGSRETEERNIYMNKKKS